MSTHNIHRMYQAIENDGCMDKFKTGVLPQDRLKEYVNEFVPKHEQELMARAQQKRNRKTLLKQSLKRISA